ncbi:hypothetical protein BD324DRAFT_648990 [Kockovaella imperatae]|uniref:Uncharacterized protein n=1 Tax=Kockovaella imperatae TaxID=4999 RepID=A0A1Y1ULF9_9TREE|nr:hypothetical protein BD324DRAFT_648990 [Kockovaella imperatae]ORX38883.1 hypothetical protein BD324DRAFT_648990 [Kockovaella imperatae]
MPSRLSKRARNDPRSESPLTPVPEEDPQPQDTPKHAPESPLDAKIEDPAQETVPAPEQPEAAGQAEITENIQSEAVKARLALRCQAENKACLTAGQETRDKWASKHCSKGSSKCSHCVGVGQPSSFVPKARSSRMATRYSPGDKQEMVSLAEE